MIKLINYKDNLVRVQDNGKGDTLVFLHGYLESLEIWNNITEELQKNFRVVAIDLPGHGQSGVYSDIHEMDFMADVLKSVLDHLNIEKCVLIGHSMGGYVGLAFLEMYSHYLTGFSLFHSSPFADSEDKKEKRNREIELIKLGKGQLIYSNHVPKTFAEDNIDKFKKDIENGIAIAKNTHNEGVIAALNGMKQRPDRSATLRNSKVPFLYVHGMKDQFISTDVMLKIQFPLNHKILILENSGHMGFIEERNRSLQEIKTFAITCFKQ